MTFKKIQFLNFKKTKIKKNMHYENNSKNNIFLYKRKNWLIINNVKNNFFLQKLIFFLIKIKNYNILPIFLLRYAPKTLSASLKTLNLNTIDKWAYGLFELIKNSLNFLYFNTKEVFLQKENVVIIFNAKNNMVVLKELNALGIPSVGLLDFSDSPKDLTFWWNLDLNSKFDLFLLKALFIELLSCNKKSKKLKKALLIHKKNKAQITSKIKHVKNAIKNNKYYFLNTNLKYIKKLIKLLKKSKKNAYKYFFTRRLKKKKTKMSVFISFKNKKNNKEVKIISNKKKSGNFNLSLSTKKKVFKKKI